VVQAQHEYRLYPVTDVLAGTMTYAAGRIPELLQAFATFVASAPDEMRVVGEVLPSEQGTRFHMLVCHCGDPRHGIDLLRPLRALKQATPAEMRGQEIFLGKGQCASCHQPPFYTWSTRADFGRF
jgi:hypothetical protein